jgi:hypothetical protein
VSWKIDLTVVAYGRTWWFSAMSKRSPVFNPSGSAADTPGKLACYDKCKELVMAKKYSIVEDSLKQFIESQQVFFVGTAPLDGEGHVNISPKGLDTLRILGPRKVAYLDLTGSGIETVAHLKENGRIVFMFCAFQGPPKIVRLYGKGDVVEPRQPEFAELQNHFPEFEGVRAIIVVNITRIADSCGYAVPLLKSDGDRSQLTAWVRNRGLEGLREYRQQKNRASIDGLPGLTD